MALIIAAEAAGISDGLQGPIVGYLLAVAALTMHFRRKWNTLGKKTREVHYNIQMKPGTGIVTHGNAAVFGWNGFVTAVSSIYKASS